MGTFVGVLIALAAVAAGVVLWIRRGILSGISAGQDRAALEIERERIAQMQAAAAEERAERAERFDAKAETAATDPAAAADLLRTTVGGEDDPDAN